MGTVWGVGVQSGGWGSRFEIKPTWMKAVMNDVVVIVTEVGEDMRVMRGMLTMTMVVVRIVTVVDMINTTFS